LPTWVRKMTRVVQLSVLATSLGMSAYTMGVTEAIKDPEYYEALHLNSSCLTFRSSYFIKITENDRLTASLFKPSTVKPGVFAFKEKASEEDAPTFTPVNPKSEAWVLADMTRFVFRRIKGAALKITEEALHKELQKDQAEQDQMEIQELKEKISELKKEWKIVFLGSSTPNAFVHSFLPRHVFVTYGLFTSFCFNQDELATVLAHELTHAVEKHNEKTSMFKLAVSTLSLVVLSVLDPVGILTLAAELGISFGFRPIANSAFSRSCEHEADQRGSQYATRACYQPNKFPALFFNMAAWEEKILNQQGKDSEVSMSDSLLSTHPISEERKKLMEGQLESLNKLYKEYKCEDLVRKKKVYWEYDG